jgi:hypothetical protein
MTELEHGTADQPVAILSAADGSARFRIRVLGRAAVATSDPWETNRLEVELEGRAHQISAVLRGPHLLTTELGALAGRLRALGRNGPALPSPFMEPAIEWTLEPVAGAPERYRVELRLGELGRPTEADARFAFDTDRGHLARFADGLERIIQAFPVVGRP